MHDVYMYIYIKSDFFVLSAVRLYLIVIDDIMCRNTNSAVGEKVIRNVIFSTILDCATSNVNMITFVQMTCFLWHSYVFRTDMNLLYVSMKRRRRT